jgi:hypothetical protein
VEAVQAGFLEKEAETARRGEHNCEASSEISLSRLASTWQNHAMVI